jgi:hypothetical protein
VELRTELCALVCSSSGTVIQSSRNEKNSLHFSIRIKILITSAEVNLRMIVKGKSEVFIQFLV